MPHKTNIELITHIMNFSRAGPLMQAFVITAIHSYAVDIIHADLRNWSPNNLINPDAWKACALEIKVEIEQNES